MKIKIAMVVSFAIGAAVLFFFLSLANAEDAKISNDLYYFSGSPDVLILRDRGHESSGGGCSFKLIYEEEGESKESINGMREVEILKFPCVFKKGEPMKMTFNKEIVLEWPDKNGAGAMFTIQKGTTLTIKD